MAREEVAEFALRLDAPIRWCDEFFINGGHDAVHAGADGPRRVFEADGGGDGVRPVPCFFRRFEDGHAVAFIAELPRLDGGLVLQFTDETADETDLPFDGERVAHDIQPFEGLRHVEDAAHPAGHEADDEFDAVFRGDVAHRPESLEHRFIDTC